MEKIIFTWSGGKDSSMALYEILSKKQYEVVSLLTSVTEDYDRISMHGVRTALLEQQAESIGIPLDKILISKQSSNEEYESKMRAALEKYIAQGIKTVAFGDIFLEECRKYRETNLEKVGMKAVFPIWGRDTKELSKTFIGLGFKTVLTCVDTKVLDGSFAGRDYDEQLLLDLPRTADPCGENGEFHTFTYDGPIFKQKISFTKGERVLRNERFSYCDLVI